jgi:hypothetical protein
MNNEKRGQRIAQAGIDEQDYIKDLLNNDDNLCNKINEKFGYELKKNAIVLKGSTKTDIVCGNCNIQVKKTKNGQMGQVFKHWINFLINNLPELKDIEYMLKSLCELPVIYNDNIKYCDTSKEIIKLNNTNYTQEELYNLINILERNKRKMINFALLGNNEKYIPDIFICSVYNKKRDKIIIWKTIDIINLICDNPVKIRDSGTIIQIGNCFIFQRKGGDCGKETANQFQFKLIPTKLSTKDALIIKL